MATQGFNTTEVMFAAGSGVYVAAAGTAEPADPTTAPPAAWTNMGYISEDGVTLNKTPDEQTFGAWQSPDPIVNIEVSRVQTLAMAMRQWDPKVLAFALNGATATQVGPPPTGDFTPSKNPPPEQALLLRWLFNTYATQLYCPRGKVGGDISVVLSRSAPADIPITFTLTPSGAENAYHLISLHPSFVTPPTAFEAGTTAADVGAGFDPSSHTVAEVADYVSSHPEDRDVVLALEQAGQNRTTLVAQLEAMSPAGATA